MRIVYDPSKREKTFRDRGLDFEDAAIVFAGTTVEIEDTRRNYGEPRIILLRLAYGPNGRDRIHPARRRATRLQHAKGKQP